MSRLGRYFQRLVIFLIAAATLWIIVTQVYDRIDRRVPAYAALLATYVIAAYVVIPFVARLTVRVLRRERIPRVTRAGDGLAALSGLTVLSTCFVQDCMDDAPVGDEAAAGRCARFDDARLAYSACRRQGRDDVVAFGIGVAVDGVADLVGNRLEAESGIARA